MTTSRTIAVLAPLEGAFEKTKQILFSPFDLGRWFTLGFSAWLAQLGESGGSFPGPGGGGRNGGDWPQMSPETLVLIVAIVAVIVILAVAVGILMLWLSSRGKFMFIECLTENKAEIKGPWARSREKGWQLFIFRFVVGLMMLVTILISIAIPLLIAIPSIKAAVFGVSAMIAVGVGVLLLLLNILLWIFVWFGIEDFTIPLMAKQGLAPRAAFRRYVELCGEQPGAIICFWLMRALLGMGVAMVAMLVCCCTCCLVLVPYIGTVILLPVFVFLRSYALLFLAQFGPEYDLWQPVQGAL